MAAYAHLHWRGSLVDHHQLITAVEADILEDYQERYPGAEVVVCSIMREPPAVARMVELLGSRYSSPADQDLLSWVYDFLTRRTELFLPRTTTR
jgi:hypothetical protein